MKRHRETPIPRVEYDLDDDTDEMELSPEQAHALSLATVADDPASSTAEILAATDDSTPAQFSFAGPAPRDRWSWLRISTLLGTAAAMVAAGSLWRCTAASNPPPDLDEVNELRQDVPAVPTAPAASLVSGDLAAPTTLAPANPSTPTIRIRNEFDRSEVFEFPANTGEAKARALVADMLLQRARERANATQRR